MESPPPTTPPPLPKTQAEAAKRAAQRRAEMMEMNRARSKPEDTDSDQEASDSSDDFVLPSQKITTRVVAKIRGELMQTKRVNSSIACLHEAAGLLQTVIKQDSEQLS